MNKAQRARITAIDKHVGVRLRERRIMLGLTQDDLAKLLGVTYQQAHKYERGINRMTAGKLYEAAQALKVPVSYFYEGIGTDAPPVTDAERMCLEHARNYSAIRDPEQRRIASELVRSFARMH